MEFAEVFGFAGLVHFEEMEADAEPEAAGFGVGEASGERLEGADGFAGAVVDEAELAGFGAPNAAFGIGRPGADVGAFGETFPGGEAGPGGGGGGEGGPPSREGERGH